MNFKISVVMFLFSILLMGCSTDSISNYNDGPSISYKSVQKVYIHHAKARERDAFNLMNELEKKGYQGRLYNSVSSEPNPSYIFYFENNYEAAFNIKLLSQQMFNHAFAMYLEKQSSDLDNGIVIILQNVK